MGSCTSMDSSSITIVLRPGESYINGDILDPILVNTYKRYDYFISKSVHVKTDSDGTKILVFSVS